MLLLPTLLYAVIAADRPPPEPINVVDEFGRPMFTVQEASLPAKSARQATKKAPTKPPGRVRCPVDTVHIAGGKFRNQVIPEFCLDAHEVTVGKFAKHLAALDKRGEINQTRLSELKRRLKTVAWPGIEPPELSERGRHCTWGQLQKHPDLPINCVSYAEAEQYCLAQGRRLPSEREWRWAARGRKAGWPYPWGTGQPTHENVNMAHGEAEPRLSAVGMCSASRSGLHDMAGNVWEWVAGDPAATGSTAYGGGFRSRLPREVKVTAELKAATRSARSDEVGFRCAGPTLSDERSP